MIVAVVVYDGCIRGKSTYARLSGVDQAANHAAHPDLYGGRLLVRLRRVLSHSPILAHALLGTALLASGTSALNQWYEVDSDAKMRRTRHAPLPAGRIKRSHGLRIRRLLLSAAGFADSGTARICLRRRSVCSRF